MTICNGRTRGSRCTAERRTWRSAPRDRSRNSPSDRTSIESVPMELPRRKPGDQYTQPGQYLALQSRVRQRARTRSIPTLFIYCFDFRTRIGPFLFLDKTLIPGAAPAIGAALGAAGLSPLRLV